MKINIQNAPEQIRNPESSVEIGNVYKNQKGYIYIIAAQTKPNSLQETKSTALVVDREGEIKNVVCYSTYYFSRFNLLGKAINLPDEIEIDWFI